MQKNSKATSEHTLTKEMMPDRIVFLDFDGVCNAVGDGSYMDGDPKKYGPSKKCVANVIKLCEKTGAGIVISSNWRKFDEDGYWVHDGHKWFNPLPKLRKMIGFLEVAKINSSRGVSKLQAILDFLNSYKMPVVDFVVLDDDEREGLSYFGEQYFHIDPKRGLTSRHVEKITEYFGD